MQSRGRWETGENTVKTFYPGQLALSGLILAAVTCGSANALTLKETVDLAINTNPDVAAVANDREVVASELREARANYYPQFDIRADVGPGFNENLTTDELGHDDGVWRLRNTQSATVRQRLFDGFETDSSVEEQKARLKSTEFRVEEAAEVIGLDAVRAYLDVLRQFARAQIAEQNLSEHRNTLTRVQRNAEEGVGNQADVSQVQARLANAEAQLLQRRNDLANAQAFFIRIVGQAPDTLSDVSAATNPPQDLNEAINIAKSISPTLEAKRAEVQASMEAIGVAESGYYPHLSLELSGNRAEHLGGRAKTDHEAAALVVMQWNLFRGGADEARARQAKYRLAKARDELRSEERKVEENVRVSWNAMETARANLSVLDREVQANQATQSAYQRQFEIGQRSLIDLLDAHNEVFLARDAYANAKFTELFASYRLMASMGQLRKALAVTQ